jgi:hypothetical protein
MGIETEVLHVIPKRFALQSGEQIFQKLRSYLEIPGARRMT